MKTYYVECRTQRRTFRPTISQRLRDLTMLGWIAKTFPQDYHHHNHRESVNEGRLIGVHGKLRYNQCGPEFDNSSEHF